MIATPVFAAWLSAPLATAMAEPIELQWWHAMTSVNADRVNKIAADFNASQDAYKIVPVFKGSYAETMNAGVAAYRAGNAPHIIQIFEVGTATMMGAKGAVKPVYQLMAEAGEPFDSNAYLPAVAAYYSTADGKMLSLPFNSSAAITYWNRDAFKKAGLDPDRAPSTWPDILAAAQKLRAAGVACGLTAAWISWTQIEQFSAWHNIPLATKANGLEGADAQLEFNNPILAKHIRYLSEAQKDKSFDYGGRTSEPEGKFVNGECGMIQTSSAAFGLFKAGAKFDFGMAELPYYPDVAGAPQNSIIGGASLWVMGGKKTRRVQGRRQVLYLSVADRAAAAAARGNRLPADHQGSLCSDASVRVLREKPGSRDPRHPDDGKTAHCQFARAAARQSGADPRHHRRGSRSYLRRQTGCAERAG
jgi:sn-glycerol 3-phosphate transport system substrate-binding protein